MHIFQSAYRGMIILILLYSKTAYNQINEYQHVIFPFEPEFDSSYIVHKMLYKNNNRIDIPRAHINDFKRVDMPHWGRSRNIIFRDRGSRKKDVLTYRYDKSGYLMSEKHNKKTIRTYVYKDNHHTVYVRELSEGGPLPDDFLIHHFNIDNVIDSVSVSDVNSKLYENRELRMMNVYENGYLKHSSYYYPTMVPDTVLFLMQRSQPASAYMLESLREIQVEADISPVSAFKVTNHGTHDSTIELRYRNGLYKMSYIVKKYNKKSMCILSESVERQEANGVFVVRHNQIYYQPDGKKYIMVNEKSNIRKELQEYVHYSRGSFPFYKWHYVTKNNFLGEITTYRGTVFHLFNRYYVKKQKDGHAF